jgi:hypothetical protein
VVVTIGVGKAESLGTAALNGHIIPAVHDEDNDKCIWSIGEMMVCRGKQKFSGEKPVPLPFCPPHITHELAWNLIHTSKVKS